MATIMKISAWTSLSVILLSLEFIVSDAATSENLVGCLGKFERFNHCEDPSILANNALENFNRVLNIVTRNPDFQPLFISVGTFGTDNKILDTVMEYLAKQTLDYYRFDLKNLNAEDEANSQTGLTWIIVVDQYEALKSHVHGHPDFWRATYQFVVFFVGNKTNEPSDDWSNIFHSLWNIHKVCKILITSINNDFSYLYRFMPFDEVNRRFGKVQRINVENTNLIVEEKKEAETSLYDKAFHREAKIKIFENFRKINGYPIYVTVFSSLMMNIIKNKNNRTYTLLDANVMKVVEDRMGAKFSITLIEKKNDVDTFMKALDTVEAGQSDIVFTAYFLKKYYRPFEYTTSIFEDGLCLIAPSSQPLPKFLTPILPFTKELWLIILLYNIVVAILWFLVQMIQSRIREKKRLNAAVSINIDIRIPRFVDPTMNRKQTGGFFNRPLRGFGKSVNTNFHHRDKPREIHPCMIGSFGLITLACYPLFGGKTCMERVFLFGTLFFCLIMFELYQSCLVLRLSKPPFYPELETLSDVADSNRTIITRYENIKENTFKHGTPIADKLHKKIVIFTSEEKTLAMVAYEGFVSIGRANSFELENLTEYYSRETNKLLLHMVKECPRTYQLAYPTRLYSPYLPRIDDLLLRMKQSGLVQKWYEDMLFETKLRVSKNIPNRIDIPRLRLEHLWLTFLGLGIGIFFSTVVFISELIYTRRLSCIN